MQLADRNKAILNLLQKRRERTSVSPKAARDALISDGIYTKQGKLRKHYRLKPKKG